MRVSYAATLMAFAIAVTGCGSTAQERTSQTPSELRVAAGENALLRPGTSGLPRLGFVFPLAGGLVLADLGGRVLGHLPASASLDEGSDLTFASVPGIAYVVDDHRLVREGKHRIRLAGGAEIVGSLASTWEIARKGDLVWRSAGRSFAGISQRRDVVTAQDPDGKRVAFDVLTARSRRIPTGCTVTDRRHDAWILVCADASARTSTIESLSPDGRSRLLSKDRSWSAGPSAIIKTLNDGHWQWAEIAPNGSTLLAQWSGECETPRAFFIPAEGGRPVPATGERRLESTPESTALGWLANGRAIVAVPRIGGCGPGARAPGVYSITPGGAAKLLVRPRRGVTPDLWRSMD